MFENCSVSVSGTPPRCVCGTLRPSTPQVWSLFAVRPPVSHLSLSSPALPRGDQSRMHLTSASRSSSELREPHCGADFLLNTVRPPVSVSLLCGIPTSAECFEASPPLLPGASRAGCWLPQARLSFHAPSQARHWLKIRTIMFWTLRCCDISWNICTRSLLGHTGLLRELFVPVV